MTFKNGFIIGLAGGGLTWLICNGIFVFTPAPDLAKNMALYIFSALIIISFLVGLASLFMGRSALGTTGNGIVFGFTTVYDGLYIAIQFASGNWVLAQTANAVMLLLS